MPVADEPIATTPDSSSRRHRRGRHVRRPSQRRGTAGHTAPLGRRCSPSRAPPVGRRPCRPTTRPTTMPTPAVGAEPSSTTTATTADDVDRPDGAATADGGVDDLFARLRAGREVVDGVDVDAPGIRRRRPMRSRRHPVRPARRGADAAHRRQRAASSSGCSPTSRTRCSTRCGGQEPVRSVDDLLSDADRAERHATSTPISGRAARRRRGRRRLDAAARCRRQLVAGRWPRRLAPVAGVAPRRPRRPAALRGSPRASPTPTATTTSSPRASAASTASGRRSTSTSTSTTWSALAYGRGALAALTPGTPVPLGGRPERSRLLRTATTTRWRVRRRPASPFPTGHLCAPAHAGCRCMLARRPTG